MESRLGKYILVRIVGSGKEGDVWEALDTELGNRRVALKVVNLVGKTSRDVGAILDRFNQSADITAKLNHRDIVQVFEKGTSQDGSKAFLAMEFVEGGTLRQALDGPNKPSLRRAIEIMSQTLEALQYCHENGTVHRDVKPSNLMLGADKRGIKVTDFGVAHSKDSDLTGHGQIIGTPTYMSPEQFSGTAKPTAQFDIWACGVVLYEMLTGRRPFEGTDWRMIERKVETEDAVPPSRIVNGITQALDDVVLCALRREPARRFDTAEDFARALRAAVPVTVDAEPAARSRWIQRLAIAAVAVAAIAFIPSFVDKATRVPPPLLSLPERVKALRCSSILAIPVAGSQKYSLRGIIGDSGRPDGPSALLEAIIKDATEDKVQRDFDVVPMSLSESGSAARCELFKLVRDLSGSDDRPGVRISAPGGPIFGGTNLEVSVRAPDYDGELWIVDYDSTDTASHIEADQRDREKMSIFRSVQKGDQIGDAIFIQYPFGIDIIIAIVTEKRPEGWDLQYHMAEGRRKYEDEEGNFYIHQLAAAARLIKSQGKHITADAVAVLTCEQAVPASVNGDGRVNAGKKCP